MKTIKKYTFSLIIIFFSLTSCNNYFDSIPENVTTLDDVFSSRVLALQWLSNVYQYLPDESEQNYTGGSDETRGIWTPASLEGDLPWEHCNSNYVNNGTINQSSGYVESMWKAYYKGIQKANIYLKRIDECDDMDEATKLRTKAEARALRSIYYFNLFKIYGPFVNIGDEIYDNEADISTMMRERNTVDECIDYIVSEFDIILNEDHLFSHFSSEDGTFQTQFAGNITKQAVEAIRSQVLLYSASYLFNGDTYYRNMKNSKGEYMFPQSRDNSKWEKAKQAAKNFIDNNPGFQLVFRGADGAKATTIAGSDPYYSVSESFLGRTTNEEMIFYSTRNGWNLYYYMKPKHSGITDAQSGAGALTVPLQFVDLFFTNKGLKIEDDPGYFNYTNDEEDKFTARNMTSVDTYKDIYSGYAYFIPASSSRIMKQFYNREPRFYINFTFQNRRWDFDESKTYYTDFSLNGNSGQAKNGHDYPKSGMLARKKIYKSGNVPYNIYIRLTEIYLNYAEACAELGEYQNAVDAVNLIRARAGIAEYGLNGDATLGARGETRIALGNADVLNAVRRERLIEMAYENQHYFDVRRWGVAGMTQGDGWIYPTWHQGGEGGDMSGFNVLVDMSSTATGNTMYFYKRRTWESRIFTDRMNLFPIPQSEINVNKNMVQNTGW